MKLPPLTPNEALVQLLVVAGTNAANIPCVWRCYRHRCYYEMWIGIATTLVSFLYHACEVTRQPILGMNDGKWHRLDNVFAILTFVSLMLWLMDNRDPKTDEFFRWFFVVLTTWAQEKAPWVLAYTVVPVLLSVFICLAKFVVVDRQPPSYLRAPAERRKFLTATATLAVSMYFFVKGLDDTNDYLRINHGLWHLFSGLAFFQYFSLDVSGKGQVKVE
ncbi:hypothetical protein DIPPA_04730 [Diplonema papillatum]|nr:hypothetical protein DIPPA_04730 [Diplonema papillatum]